MIKKVTIIPLEVIIRNIAAGSMAKRLGINEGLELSAPVFEICFKDDGLGDPLINDDHAINVLKIVTKKQLEEIKNITARINEIMCKIFINIGIRLVDFKIEFGFDAQGSIILADEISPDTCRLWDLRIPGERGGERGGDVRSVQMGEMPSPVDTTPVADVYTELARRLGVLPSNVTHQIKPSLIN